MVNVRFGLVFYAGGVLHGGASSPIALLTIIMLLAADFLWTLCFSSKKLEVLVIISSAILQQMATILAWRWGSLATWCCVFSIPKHQGLGVFSPFPTDTHMYLRYDSAHPPKCKDGLPYSQFLGLRRICTKKEDYLTHSQTMSSKFAQKGYPQPLKD